MLLSNVAVNRTVVHTQLVSGSRSALHALSRTSHSVPVTHTHQRRHIFSHKRRLSSSTLAIPFALSNTNSATTAPLQFLSNVSLCRVTPGTITTSAKATAPNLDKISAEAATTAAQASASPVEDSFLKKAVSCQSETEREAVMAARAAKKALRETKETWWAPYVALTKPRLTVLVVLSAMSSYALTPEAVSLTNLLFLTVGTALCSGSANAINMGREPAYDSMMTRTRGRPVVRGAVTPNQAFTFAGITGTVGTAALYFGVNPTVAILGASNIALYGGLYTTLKRKHIINTWVGAVVGAIPPLMGWAASGGSLLHPGAWCLAGLLYAWQFPHFNALSYSIRDEYKKAGYVMTAWKNPGLNARVGLRYALLMFPLCVGLSYYNVTDWWFVLDSSVLNAWMAWWAFKFWQQENVNIALAAAGKQYSQNPFARKLFWGSVVHLPGVLLLAMIHKKGQWDWLFGPSEDEKKKTLSS
ncbi:YALIA101S03e08438g1_1 [Yarrowia lipolytica]|nr:Protoheme IX farnesyltransferase [Yarrowia lipolytica]SEI33022.1 YALIA101S03e08438g1_1 [Yarrowia lipolytica]VBB82519.1 Heme A:farnesyltransferase, putative [Yarrowia lipolytica]